MSTLDEAVTLLAEKGKELKPLPRRARAGASRPRRQAGRRRARGARQGEAGRAEGGGAAKPARKAGRKRRRRRRARPAAATKPRRKPAAKKAAAPRRREAGLTCRAALRRGDAPPALEGGAAALHPGRAGQGRQDRDRPAFRPRPGPAPTLRELLKDAEGGGRDRPRRPPRLRRARPPARDGGGRGHRHRPRRRRRSPGRSAGRRTRAAAADLHAPGARRASRRWRRASGCWRGSSRPARGKYEGTTIKRLAGARAASSACSSVHGGGRIVPTDRRARREWLVPPGEAGGAEAGEIVLAEPLPGRGLGLRPARIVERLGRMGEPRSVSLICIHAHGIPTTSPPRRLRRGRARPAPSMSAEREDLRDVPLVTIDGEDARDFDDAVCAEPDGHRLAPARRHRRRRALRPSRLARSTARPGRAATASTSPTASCRCCRRRCRTAGAACAPARTAAASSSRCASTPAARKTAHRFGRGLMRSAARLTYEQVQAAQDAGEDPTGTLRAALRRLPRPARGARAARHARPRPAGAAGACSTRPARCWRSSRGRGSTPPADRGVHGRRQCLRGGGAGAAARSPACTGCTTRPRTRSWRRCGNSSTAFGIALPPATSCIRATSPVCWSRSPAPAERGW